MAKWRAEPQEKTGGRYWVLRKGKGPRRVSLSLKYVPDEVAAQALSGIQELEDTGRVSWLVELHRQDPATAIRYLLGDRAEADLRDPPPVDYAAMPLRAYYRDVYTPWRREDAARSWRREDAYWTRILRELGDLRLREVTERVVANYVDALTSERGPRKGLPAAGNTKRLHRAAIQALLTQADRLGHIEGAPNLGRFRIRGSTRVVAPRVDPLTLPELVALMAASGPKHRAMWAVGAGEGLRPSELRRLRWEDVRWATRTLWLRGDERGEGKTELSTAEIPLTPLAHRELRRWWVRCGQPAEGVMFLAESRTGREGAAYESDTAYRRALATAAKRAKIGRKVTMYLLRHSFATIAWSVGVDKDVARRILRHTDERMLDEVYCRPRPADLVERVAAFDAADDSNNEEDEDGQEA